MFFISLYFFAIPADIWTLACIWNLRIYGHVKGWQFMNSWVEICEYQYLNSSYWNVVQDFFLNILTMQMSGEQVPT